MALLPPARATQGVRLLCELDERGQFDAGIAREALPGVVATTGSHGGALANCGLIFATLVRLRGIAPDQFGEVFPDYHFEVVVAFLTEISRLKLVQQVSESSYWMRYAWRPPHADHVALSRAIAKLESADDRADVSQLFPLYARIAELDDIISSPEEEDGVAGWASELPEDIRTSEEFVSAAMQIAVEAGDHALVSVAPLFADHRDLVMLWFERHATSHTLTTQEREKLLRIVEQNAHFK